MTHETAESNRPIGPTTDCHMHFYDGRYPASPGSVLFPPDATPAMYSALREDLDIDRTVVVQPTTYGLDNTCQLDGMMQLAEGSGAHTVRGVMVVDTSTTQRELRRLHEAGVRGARFHMLPGGAVGWDQLAPVAMAIADFGWHIQLQMNGRELPERLPLLLDLPTDVVVDHVGRFMPPVTTQDPAFHALLTLIETKGWVKISAPYESSVSGAPDYVDVEPLAAALIERVGDKALWATNWPHPGRTQPPSPHELLALLARWIPDADLARRILVENPTRLYDFPESPTSQTKET